MVDKARKEQKPVRFRIYGGKNIILFLIKQNCFPAPVGVPFLMRIVDGSTSARFQGIRMGCTIVAIGQAIGIAALENMPFQRRLTELLPKYVKERGFGCEFSLASNIRFLSFLGFNCITDRSGKMFMPEGLRTFAAMRSPPITPASTRKEPVDGLLLVGIQQVLNNGNALPWSGIRLFWLSCHCTFPL